MKTFLSTLAKIFFVLLLIQGWFLYEYYNKNQVLIADNIQLEQQLLVANESLVVINEKVEKLEKNSLNSVLKETNEAVVKGWESLLNSVESELERARESVDSTIDDLRQQLPENNNQLNNEKEEKSPAVIQGERT